MAKKTAVQINCLRGLFTAGAGFIETARKTPDDKAVRGHITICFIKMLYKMIQSFYKIDESIDLREENQYGIYGFYFSGHYHYAYGRDILH